MVSETDLAKLIQRLKNATSLNEQLRLLVRSWRTVRALSQEQRRNLATQIGLAEAETLLERLGRPSGLAPARLLRAIQQTEKSQPGELHRILSGLQDPGQRAETVRSSLNLLESALAAPAVQDALQPPVEVEPATSEPAEPPTPPAPPISEADAPASPPETPAEESEAPGKPLERATEEAFRVPRPEIPPPESEPKREETEEKPARKQAEAIPQTAAGNGASLPQQLASATSLVQRFRLLRSGLHDKAQWQDPKKILEAFPQGWPRRRVLCAMIRAGCLHSTEELLPLLQALAVPADRFWCASTFLHLYPHSNEELGVLLTGLDPGVAGRLARRFSVSSGE